MIRRVSIVVAAVLLLGLTAVPANTFGANDDFESLEFFLDQSLQRTNDPSQRMEILNRYMIKALGLLYRQNQELLRLRRESLNALQDIQELESERKKELERQLQRR
ncbi:MAG: hypothetical protein JSU72_05145 [Deltaproteobacteria bacterium]|nr:MAG: hypothetical protein JSU72_05145 [Deltaproteobacteria bacterium]